MASEGHGPSLEKLARPGAIGNTQGWAPGKAGAGGYAGFEKKNFTYAESENFSVLAYSREPGAT